MRFDGPVSSPESPGRTGESRWPMLSAVVAIGVLHLFLPADFLVAGPWVFQGVLLLFLAVLVIGDPGRIDRRRTWLRVTTGLMIGTITVTNAVLAARLVVGILENERFDTAQELLLIGGVIWLTNIVAFALWFWDLDQGGAAERAAASRQSTPAFVFPEMTNPEHAPPGWYPQFVDYLTLSFNTATAFSPTDVSPIKRWSKLLTAFESAISLLLALLVIARAVNIL